MTIDREEFKNLAWAQDATVKTICEGLGIAPHIFYYHVKKDPELKAIYDEARKAGTLTPGRAPTAKARPKKSKKSSKKARSTDTPPRNGHAKSSLDDSLRKQLVAEFHYIDAWGEVSEHFDELRERVLALA